jgi:hypothetical protein
MKWRKHSNIGDGGSAAMVLRACEGKNFRKLYYGKGNRKLTEKSLSGNMLQWRLGSLDVK